MTDDSKAAPRENRESRSRSSEASVGNRDDPLDAGVPMLPGDGSEPVGPEDALGIGPKRGDYTGRIGPENYQPHQSVPIPDAEPGEAHSRLEPQRPRADDRGDDPGVKGGTMTVEERDRASARKR